MNKVLKIIGILIVLLNMMILFVPNISQATFSYKTELNETWIDTKADKDVGKSTENIVGTAIQVVRIVGIGMATIMLTYVAIKYMTAAPSEKAEFKKSATAYIVGAIVLFGTSALLTIIAKFAKANIT